MVLVRIGSASCITLYINLVYLSKLHTNSHMTPQLHCVGINRCKAGLYTSLLPSLSRPLLWEAAALRTSSCSVFSFSPARMSQSMTKPSCPAGDTHTVTLLSFWLKTTARTQRTCAHQYPGISWMCLQHKDLTSMTLQWKPHTIIYHSILQYTSSYQKIPSA